MDKPISNSLRIIFLVHAIVSALFGVALWLVPGRFLILVGWVRDWVWLVGADVQVPGSTFVDPYITRGLGAALLALAFSSFLGWRTSRWGEVAIVVKLETVFCLLALMGLFGSMVVGEQPMPAFGWVEAAILAGFGVAWGWAWWYHSRMGNG